SRWLRLRSIANRLVEVHHPDPDVARRRQLLNILLLSMLSTCLAILMVGLLFAFVFHWSHGGALFVIGISLIAFGFAAGLYVLNHSRWMRWAPIVFVLGLLVIITFSDDAMALLVGGSATLFIFPIVASSILLRPSASFWMTLLVTLDMLILAWSKHIDLLSFSDLNGTIGIEIITYFALALVSWLAASSVEKAFADLRQTNRQLDQRVNERTQALAQQTQNLAETLVHVQIESAKNRAILESIGDGVIVFDNAGTATLANPAATQFIESPRPIEGARLVDLLQLVATQAECDQIMQLFRERSQSQSVTARWGAHRVLSISASPIQLESDPQALGTVLVCRDFTREAELARLRNVFVSMISHELRTPLVAILSQTEMLNLSLFGELTDRQVQSIKRITTNAQRLLHLTSDLLDQSRIEAGATLTLHPVTFSTANLVDDLLAATLEIARAKQLQLTAQLGADLPARLVGDSQRLLQILINLVINAIKYTDTGSIRVDIARVDAARWQLQVSDSGRGIPIEEQAHIFEPFRQVQAGAQPGAGLGLTIVKHLVEVMQGEIQLSSQVGQGSIFTVTLPLIAAPAIWGIDQ
ncbi:MAG TPA: ATP-binding protein, partial [Anaerolineae bacterium]